MSQQNDVPGESAAATDIPKGPGFRAQVDEYSCEGSAECVKACPDQAIKIGPERIPTAVCKVDGEYKLLPGRAEVLEDKCTGCAECVSACPENAIQMVEVQPAQ